MDVASSPGARVLIVGGGARNHALGEALRASPSVAKVVFAPGTSGLERLGYETAPVASQDFPGLVELAQMEEYDLTVVGPNTPLVTGLVDAFDAEGLPIFGPNRDAAMLEGSKVFARLLMNRLAIRTPKFAVCNNADRALHLARTQRWARVFKADGIAYGKGVRVTRQLSEVERALQDVLEENIYGLESEQIVVEERIDGEEVTVFCLTDGVQICDLGYVRNHPRLYDGEHGPPTRSMGQVAPAPEINGALAGVIRAEVLEPTIAAMAERETPMRGALFVDLMMVGGKPYVIDYNVRFGDPATQTLLTAYSGDFYAALQACRGQGDLRQAVAALTVDPRPRVSLVVVCDGYPLKAVRGDAISVDYAVFEHPDLWLFEDGVRWVPASEETADRIETTGGRTFTVVAAAETVAAARQRAYDAVKAIRFRGMHYRRDIAADAVAV